MNDPFLTDRDDAKGLLRWREAPPKQVDVRPVEPGSCKVSAAVLSDPYV